MTFAPALPETAMALADANNRMKAAQAAVAQLADEEHDAELALAAAKTELGDAVKAALVAEAEALAEEVALLMWEKQQKGALANMEHVCYLLTEPDEWETYIDEDGKPRRRQVAGLRVTAAEMAARSGYIIARGIADERFSCGQRVDRRKSAQRVAAELIDRDNPKTSIQDVGWRRRRRDDFEREVYAVRGGLDAVRLRRVLARSSCLAIRSVDRVLDDRLERRRRVEKRTSFERVLVLAVPAQPGRRGSEDA